VSVSVFKGIKHVIIKYWI